MSNKPAMIYKKQIKLRSKVTSEKRPVFDFPLVGLTEPEHILFWIDETLLDHFKHSEYQLLYWAIA